MGDDWLSIDDLNEIFEAEAKKEAEERRQHPERDYSVSPYRDPTKYNSYDQGDVNDNFRP